MNLDEDTSQPSYLAHSSASAPCVFTYVVGWWRHNFFSVTSRTCSSMNCASLCTTGGNWYMSRWPRDTLFRRVCKTSNVGRNVYEHFTWGETSLGELPMGQNDHTWGETSMGWTVRGAKGPDNGEQMFLLLPAHPGSPGQRAIKRLLLLLLYVNILDIIIIIRLHHSTMYIDEDYWSRWSSVVCRPVCHSSQPRLTEHK